MNDYEFISKFQNINPATIACWKFYKRMQMQNLNQIEFSQKTLEIFNRSGKTREEIAEIIGVSVKTVHKALNKNALERSDSNGMRLRILDLCGFDAGKTFFINRKKK